MEIYYFILYFFTYGFLGWCTEVAFAAVKQGKFVNRGFLNGSYMPDIWSGCQRGCLISRSFGGKPDPAVCCVNHIGNFH